jgi:hypothetical protein
VLLHSPQAVTFFSAGFAIVLIIIRPPDYLEIYCVYYNTTFAKLQALFPLFSHFSYAIYHFFQFTAKIPPNAAAKQVINSSNKISQDKEKSPPSEEKAR